MKTSKKFCSYLALFVATLLIFVNCKSSAFAMNKAVSKNSTDSFKQVIEFENQKHFSQDNGNGVRNDQFKGYSGSGYVYLTSGWADVNFTVPSDGKYKITIVTNSDQYKENWLYLDSNSAGKLSTNANTWNQTTNEYTLTKGQHKFGVSSNWGYVALDYVSVEKVADNPTDPTKPVSGGLYVNGTTLYDGKGNPFLFRGVSVAHAWFPSYTQTSINATAKLGANSVRVVLADGFQWTKTSADEVKNIISWCRQNNLVCILEVHDHTGHNDPQELYTAADYWIGLKDILNANKDYVVVNIANEWLGDWNQSNIWASTYCAAIKKMRDAGIQNVFMVDAPGYGQQTDPLIANCTTVKNADRTGNTIFSIHMYSVAGKDAATVKSNIDNMLGKGVCTVIGEFGDYQNGGVVDASTIMSYCAQKQVGTMAWSWKGNGGQDANLDLSNDWAGTNLTDWGKFVFCSNYGIQKTSKLAYSGSGYSGPTNPTDPVTPPTNPTNPSNPVTPPQTDDESINNIKPGYLKSLATPWYVSSKGDDTTSSVSSIKKLSNGGYRLSFDLATDPYPYLVNMAKGLDFSKNSKVNVVIRNNNAYAVQLQPIFKAGDNWAWTEYDKYQEIPALTTVKLSFDMSTCAERNDVNALLFRIQGAGSKFAGSVDFLSVDTDLAADAYSADIAELNRPKSASYFTWSYPEASFKDQTTSTSCSSDGVLGIDFKNVTSKDAAGIQTETKPGLGKGLDCSPYKTVTCTITNNSSTDVSMSLLLRTTSNWTWQENCGTVNGKSGNGLIPAGKSVKVTYILTDSAWKSILSNWNYTGKLQNPEDVRAIAFKIWSDNAAGAYGKVTISNFAFNF
ncbi:MULTISPECIES: cellulase family glycosylhydrolase [Clostridium]|uniref:cellulase family glycosylhydrolase n=1 Tax=Clostridium TaxID=1485 RepID=UPI0008264D79|nr:MULTISPECIES: cellulase family glycosylhydrolase [Clostridium]PJI10218.1 hypothetical protein CUB90_21105 [Clostridium sp. CT7]